MKTKIIPIPVKDYAEKHGMTVQNVYQQLKRGKLEGKKVGCQLIYDTIID